MFPLCTLKCFGGFFALRFWAMEISSTTSKMPFGNQSSKSFRDFQQFSRITWLRPQTDGADARAESNETLDWLLDYIMLEAENRNTEDEGEDSYAPLDQLS